MLHLDRNDLTELTGYEFEPLESLRELYLQNNRLSSINPKSFSHLRSLQVLDLSGNQLVLYDPTKLSANPYLRLMWLSGNPWSCQCDFISSFRDWLHSSRVQLEDQDSIECYPLGQPVLSASNETCPDGSVRSSPNYLPSDWWVLMAATFASAFIVLFAGIVLCCCRKQLRTLVFSLCGIRLCQPDEMDDELMDKPFDALVVYSAKDDLFLKVIAIRTTSHPFSNVTILFNLASLKKNGGIDAFV